MQDRFTRSWSQTDQPAMLNACGFGA